MESLALDNVLPGLCEAAIGHCALAALEPPIVAIGDMTRETIRLWFGVPDSAVV